MNYKGGEQYEEYEETDSGWTRQIKMEGRE